MLFRSHGFYFFLVLTPILPFFGTHIDWTLFRYSPEQFFDTRRGIFLFPVLARIRPFFGTHTDWTLFRYSPELFFDSRRDSTFTRYSHGFDHFSVLTLIGDFSGTHPNHFSILARILLFLGTHSDSSIFWYSN